VAKVIHDVAPPSGGLGLGIKAVDAMYAEAEFCAIRRDAGVSRGPQPVLAESS